MEPPVVLPPALVATAMVPPDPTVTFWRAAPPVPPAAPFTLMATAPAVALVVVIEPPAPMVKLSEPAPLVLALMVTVPEVAPPTFALRTTASPLESVMAPLPVEIGVAMVSVPVVFVREIGPAPVVDTLKVAPFVSVMNTPPEPAAALIVPAVVRIGAPAAPMPLAPVVGVVRFTVPVPTLSSVAAVWVMDPPVALPPVSVATVMVPPEPVVMLRSAAVPVPPAAPLTLIPAAAAVALLVVIELPAFMVKADAPAPSELALMVTVLAPALTAPLRVMAFWDVSCIPPLAVRLFAVMSPGVPPAELVRVMLWLPALSVVPAAMVMEPAPAERLAAIAPGSLAVTEMAPLVVLTLLLMSALRPACMVRVAPAAVIAMGSVIVMSVLAWRVILVAAAAMLAGVMVLVPAGLLAKRLLTPGE